MDFETQAYIKSESEFNHVRVKAFLEMIMALVRGHHMHLLSFNEVVEKLRLKQTIYRGLQDIPVENIVGSTGRYEDFTRRFLPRSVDKREKERWRQIYTRAVTGQGFPPIEVYKIDQVYFVKDGNHRVSVARELGWETIQANVTELPNLMDNVNYFNEGVKHYRVGEWDKGVASFKEALRANENDKLAQTYIERCEHLKAEPPDDWNGVWVMTSK